MGQTNLRRIYIIFLLFVNFKRIIQNEYFVQFRAVPYVNTSMKSLDKNMSRISSYVYLVLMRLFSLPPDVRKQYIVDGSDKFNKNKRYNSIRDEFDNLSVDSQYIYNKLHTLAHYACID